MEKTDKLNNAVVNTAGNPNGTDDIYPGEENLDRRWAWLVMIAALLTHILTFGASYASVGALYVEFLEEFGGSESATSLPGSIMLGTMLCAGFMQIDGCKEFYENKSHRPIIPQGPLASILVGKFGARSVAFSGGLFASAGLILSAFATELVHLYFTFGFLTGLGYGFSYLPCIVMVGNFFERRRVAASGIAVSGSGLGTFIIAPIAQSLLNSLAYRKTLIIIGAMELILCLCGATYIPSKIPVRKLEAGGIGVEDAELGSGSVLTLSVIDNSVIQKPSEVSVLMQAALFSSSGLSFPGHLRSQMKRSISTNSRFTAAHADDIGMRTPLPQPSDGSVLAQAAICLSRFSPSLSSSLASSSSKVSENIVPAIGSPIQESIQEEWMENLKVAENNDDTLVPKRKPEFLPIPEEFVAAGSSTSHGFDSGGDGDAAIPTGMSIISDRSACDEIRIQQERRNTLTPADAERRDTLTSADFENILLDSTDNSSTHTSRLSSYRSSPAASPKPTVEHYVTVPKIHINIERVKDGEERSCSQLSLYSSMVCPKSSSHSAETKTCWEQVLSIAKLFKNRFFVLFCLSNFFVCIGYQLPYMYFKAFALSMDLGDDSWAAILAVMGVADTLGRILVGFCFGYVYTDYARLYGFVSSMVIAGVILLFTTLADSYISLFCYAGGFALVAGSTDSLVGPLLVGFVGLEQLGYSFGMIIEMQGIGFVLGPPIAGFLYSLTGTYAAVFWTGGLAFILSGLVLLLEPLIAYCRKESWTYQRRT